MRNNLAYKIGLRETVATYSLYPKKSVMTKFNEWFGRNKELIILSVFGCIILTILVMSVGLSATESGIGRNFLIRGI